ncbi:hypothetical protein QE152_g9062 [Popillia japonica]|uniref:Integrase catalytic domain-containing protein n=1 Tax=Popillia japonica TaxID=7064 RepID=A0AAW1M011_POPJA
MPFGSTEFQIFCRNWNIKSITSSPLYPRANGLAEKAVDVSKRIMKKSIESNTDVEILLLEYRSTTVPSSLLRTRIPIKDENLKPKIQINLQNTLRESQQRYKNWHDRGKRKPRHYKENEHVIVRHDSEWRPAIIKKRRRNAKIILHYYRKRKHYKEK